MKSSIYISSEKIEIIGYTGTGKNLSVKHFLARPLPEGTMMNGKIFDHSPLVECLASLKGEKPFLFTEPTLTVDGSSILSKRILVPKLKRRQYEQLVRDDFADSTESFNELVCDYCSLGFSEEAGTAILACAADKAQVDDYISAFKSAGIKLKAIRIGVQAILNYVASKPELRNSTFVFNVIDGFTMLTMIFENGINVFMSRTRLYGEDNERLIQSMLENLSGLLQFNRSQKFNDIAYSYYLGLDKNDFDFLTEIFPYPDIKPAMLDIFGETKSAVRLPSDAHFVYLSALLGKDSIDLIRSCESFIKRKKRERPKKYWILALAGVIAALMFVAGYLYKQVMDVSIGVVELKDYLEDESVVAKSEEIDEILEETTYYFDVVRQMENKIQWEESKTPISNQVLDLITQTSGGKVTVNRFEFDEDAGILRVSGNCMTETDAAGYIDTLKKSRLIKDIKYTGYSYNNKEEYNFSVDVLLAANEVEQ